MSTKRKGGKKVSGKRSRPRAGASRTVSRKPAMGGKRTKSALATKTSRFQLIPGGGIVPQRSLAKPIVPAKKLHGEGGAATSHHIKFSGQGDATNAHADTDHGTILYTAQLRLIFWGKEWASSAPPASMTTVINDVETILAGPYLEGLQQYAVSHVHVDRVIDLSLEDPPNPIGEDDAGDRVKQMIDDGVVPHPDEETTPAVYVVFLPSKVKHKTLSLPPEGGRHSSYLDWNNFWFSSIYVAWVGNDGTRDSISATFSHELVETLTDPEGDGWQVEPRSRFNWNEICDVCASGFRLNGVVVASYWSNLDNACIVPDRTQTTFNVQWIWRPNRIEWLGGTDRDGNPWQFPRQMVMTLIRGGDLFKVHGGISGKDSLVGVYYLDVTHPYLATNTDGAPDDNLLALPQRPPG
jgi:hypothetical protein